MNRSDDEAVGRMGPYKLWCTRGPLVVFVASVVVDVLLHTRMNDLWRRMNAADADGRLTGMPSGLYCWSR